MIRVPEAITKLPEIEQFAYKNIIGTINSYINMNEEINNVWQSEIHYEENNTNFKIFLSNGKQFELNGSNFEDISANINEQIPNYLKL